MRLNDRIDIEIDGNLEASGTATIKDSNLALAFAIVSEGFYSDIFGSIVREVTSNCVDSHKEAGVNDPIVIEFSEEEDVNFISFIDKGMGMSKEFFSETFMSYFESTKRESNDFYGAFGVGSKSPLGYQDSYEIITVKDGIKNHFLVYKVPDGPPNFDLLSSVETTDRNGTEVRIIIEEGDKQRFINAIKYQLVYFDNVVVKGINYDNDYQIIEGQTFKYRVSHWGVYEGEYHDMHIAQGRVCYPIDWKKLKMTPINCPVGIKFEIGELVVTKNRESLRYDKEEYNSLIKERIEATLAELGGLYNKQTSDTLTLEEYFKSKTFEQRYINLGGITSLALPYRITPGPRGGTKKEYLVKNLKDPVYKPLEGLPITIPDEPFFDFQITEMFDNSNRRNPNIFVYHNEVYKTLTERKRNVQLVRFNRRDKLDKAKGKYIAWQVRRDKHIDGVAFVEKRIHKSKDDKKEAYKDYCVNLGLVQEIRRTGSAFNPKGSFSGRYFTKRHEVPYITDTLNKTKIIQAYKKAMVKELVERLPSYRDYTVSEEYLKERRQYFASRRTVLPAGQFKVKSLSHNVDAVLESNEILKNRIITVYGFKDDTKKLRIIEELLRLNTWYTGFRRKNISAYKLYIIPKKALPYFEANEYSFNMEEFLTNGNKVFRRALTAIKVQEITQEIKKNELLLNMLPTLNTEVNNSWEKSHIYLDYATRGIVERLKALPEFLEGCNEIMDKNNWWDQELLSELDKVTSFMEGLGLLQFIMEPFSRKPTEFIEKETIEFLKYKKKRLDAVHYFVPRENEIQMIEYFLNLEEYYTQRNIDCKKSSLQVNFNKLKTHNYGS